MPRKQPESASRQEPEFSQDPLIQKRREDASDSLAGYLLDIDAQIDKGQSPSADTLANIVLRKILQLLADPLLGEAAQLKALDHLTALRAKKLVTEQPAPEDAAPTGMPMLPK